MNYNGGTAGGKSAEKLLSFWVKKWKSAMDYRALFWSELDCQDLQYRLCGGRLIQPPLRIRVTIIHYPEIDETEQFADKCYCTSIPNLTGVWL